jgi:hypothetical protein
MKLAIEIIEKEIAQRELAIKNDHLLREVTQQELYSLNRALTELRLHDNLNVKGSVVQDTFDEMDIKLSILNKDTISWLKRKVMWHISEAFERAKNISK